MDEGIGGNVRGWGIARSVDPFRKDACHFRAHSAKTGRSVSREERIGDARKSLPTCILISSPVRSFLSNETGLITGFWPLIVSRLK